MCKKKDTLSKTEKRRKERDERVDALKTKDGAKKEIQTGSHVGHVLFPIAAVVIVLLFAVWLFFAAGWARSLMTPMKVGNERIGMTEFTFYYKQIEQSFNQMVSYGMAPAGADGKLDVTKPCTMPGYEKKTWRDYILEKTREKIQNTEALSQLAKEKGYTLTADNKARMDDSIARLKTKYPSEDEMSTFLNDNFGQGMTLSQLEKIQEKLLLVQHFTDDYPMSYKFTEDEISKYYSEHKNEMDLVSFHAMIFTVPDSAKDDREKTKVQTDNKAKANGMLAQLTDAASFKTIAKDYAPDDKKASYDNGDITLYTDTAAAAVGQLGGKNASDWLYDAARKAGDKVHLTNGTNEMVLLYVGRKQMDNKLPSVRHILIGNPDAQAAPDEKQLTADKKLAEEIAGRVKSEADMPAEAKKLKASKQLYESARYDNILWHTMDTNFNNWIYDPARKPGDVGVVRSMYGYHVIYFIQKGNEQEWHYRSRQQLGAAKFKTDEANWLKQERFKISESHFAENYIK